MNGQNICRICLTVNVRMYNINNTSLQGIYEKLSCTPLSNLDGLETACFQCVARLRSCLKLQHQAVLANKVIVKLLDGSCIVEESTINSIQPEINRHKWSVVVLENINITGDDITKVDDDFNVKNEEIVKSIKVEGLKYEDGDELHNNSDIDNIEADDFKQGTDSEDDLPLKDLSDIKSEDVTRSSKRKRRYNKETKLDAVEIILTHEQQIHELMERAKSLNYLNSPYKCDYCYKGFIHSHAYENHKEKHSESSGHLECGVCRLRYRGARQLRAHAASAHERRYPCARCAHRSHTKNQALDHEKWHNGHTYPCKLCGEKFSKPTSYLTHMRKSHASEHVCAICGHSFVGRHGLLMHATKAHRGHTQKPDTNEPPDKRYCKECDIQFHSLEAWKRHVLTSVKHALWNDNSAECPICGARVSPGSRGAHRRAHARALRPQPAGPRAEPLALLPCDQCDGRFKTQYRLQAHVKRVHLGMKYNKNVVCEVCGKKCTSNATLRYHQRRHTGERPYGCGACAARFASRDQLRIHARTHSGERPYACPHCTKRFTQKPALNRHSRVHTGVKPYECQLCSKTFTQSNSMKLHVNTVHLKLAPHKKRNKIAELPQETA